MLVSPVLTFGPEPILYSAWLPTGPILHSPRLLIPSLDSVFQGNAAFSFVGPIVLLTGLVLIWSRWIALALFLYLFSAILWVSGALQVYYGPYESLGTAMEWIAPVVFLAGVGILLWRVARRTQWGALAVLFMFLISPVLFMTGAAAWSSDSYSNAILRGLRPTGHALEWGALVAFLSGLGILVWRGARKVR